MSPILYPFVTLGALALGAVFLVVLFTCARVFIAAGALAAVTGFGGIIVATVQGQTEPQWVTATAVAGLLAFAFGMIANGEFD